jgi:hypothetical protein
VKLFTYDQLTQAQQEQVRKIIPFSKRFRYVYSLTQRGNVESIYTKKGKWVSYVNERDQNELF